MRGVPADKIYFWLGLVCIIATIQFKLIRAVLHTTHDTASGRVGSSEVSFVRMHARIVEALPVPPHRRFSSAIAADATTHQRA